jgi:predicted RNA-binding Zn-ribbon protein involved in translation (DUF1610 family)
MRTFLHKIENGIRRLMEGRNGTDQLGLTALIVSLILSFFPFVKILSLAGLGYGLFRTLSRNIPQRRAENAAFLERTANLRRRTAQWAARMKNRKEYKYHRCTKCHTLIRLKRGQGERRLKCPRCGQEYTCRT